MRKLLLFLIILGGLTGAAFGQKTIKGVITAEDKAPLTGVSVVVKGTSVGALSDQNGAYTLQAPENATTLIFSFIGMKTTEVEINDQTEINLTMAVDVGLLDEVIVVGYGTMRKKDLTGAVASVKPASLENQKPQTVQDVLQR